MDGKLNFAQIEPSIRFMQPAGKVVFVIDKNGCHVPEGVSVDESAEAVINALDTHIKSIVEPLKQQRDELLAVLEEVDEGIYCASAWEVPIMLPTRIKQAIAKAKGE